MSLACCGFTLAGAQPHGDRDTRTGHYTSTSRLLDPAGQIDLRCQSVELDCVGKRGLPPASRQLAKGGRGQEVAPGGKVLEALDRCSCSYSSLLDMPCEAACTAT